MTTDLDPRWNWYAVRRLCDPEPIYRQGSCNHLEVVPVTQHDGLGGAVVAHLCLTCDEQLPAEWVVSPPVSEMPAGRVDECMSAGRSLVWVDGGRSDDGPFVTFDMS